MSGSAMQKYSHPLLLFRLRAALKENQGCQSLGNGVEIDFPVEQQPHTSKFTDILSPFKLSLYYFAKKNGQRSLQLYVYSLHMQIW